MRPAAHGRSREIVCGGSARRGGRRGGIIEVRRGRGTFLAIHVRVRHQRGRRWGGRSSSRRRRRRRSRGSWRRRRSRRGRCQMCTGHTLHLCHPCCYPCCCGGRHRYRKGEEKRTRRHTVAAEKVTVVQSATRGALQNGREGRKTPHIPYK